MEDDHKLFQDKLNELKSSMLTPQVASNPPPATVKGNEILAELDRMKERLQKGRGQSVNTHPSDRTMKQIVIDNPIADKRIDATNYEPRYQTMQNKEFENSLPNKKSLKTNLDVSQNLKFAPEESINDRESVNKQNNSEIQNLLKSQSINEEVGFLIVMDYRLKMQSLKNRTMSLKCPKTTGKRGVTGIAQKIKS